MYADDENTPAPEEPQEAAPEQPVAEAPAETEGAVAAPEAPEEGAEAGAETEESTRRPNVERRVAHLARVANEAQRERDELQRKLEEAQALLQQGNSPETNMELERLRNEVQQLRQGNAQQDFIEKRQVIIDGGVKEFGEKVWNERTEMLTAMGALRRQEFLDALVDIPDGHKLVAHLVDDPDVLRFLLDKRPAAMAAHMGRIAAELAVAETVKPKAISNAPPPVRPVGAGRVQPPPDMATLAKNDMKAYIELRNKTAPRHLGGQGKAA